MPRCLHFRGKKIPSAHLKQRDYIFSTIVFIPPSYKVKTLYHIFRRHGLNFTECGHEGAHLYNSPLPIPEMKE